MDKPRRRFLGQLSVIAGAVALNQPLTSFASERRPIRLPSSGAGNNVAIYHTNDLRGNVSAIGKPLSEKNAGAILLDGGGFLDSTGNLDDQLRVIDKMNRLGYHAATIGKNELALGTEKLAQLAGKMNFALVNCNYVLDNRLSSFIKPYIIMYAGKIKVGVTGVGQPHRGLTCNDAVTSLNKMASRLKEREKCDLVICLSHLGNKKAQHTTDNYQLAQQSENVDLIIGGDNHKMLIGPGIERNKLNQEVVLGQAGWDGLMVGKIIAGFDDLNNKTATEAAHIITGQHLSNKMAVAFQAIQSAKRVA
ncbi:MAG TPA: hypothetical protein VHA56_06230 [Mucilaginibacter sp.]|nr:hypothetical protein [Mucilaginibacter sp.]